MSLRPLQANEIGGAQVERAFSFGGRKLMRGASTLNGDLSLDDVRSMPIANRNALIENRFLSVWPAGGVAIIAPAKNGKSVIPPAEAPHGSKLHVVSRGFGKFDVIEGVVRAEGVSKTDAEALVASAPKSESTPSSSPSKRKRSAAAQ